MAWDDIKNVLGQALGDVSLFLRPASQWGTIPDVIAKRQAEVAQPDVRQSLVGSPFRAGLLGVGGKDVGGSFQPDLPELAKNGILQPVTDANGHHIGGLFMDPRSGEYFKGGMDIGEVRQKWQEMGGDPNDLVPKGVSGSGEISFERRPPAMGDIPPPPPGMVQKGARPHFDKSTGKWTWIPFAGLPSEGPGADKSIPPDQLPFSEDTGDTPPATTRTPTTTGPSRVPPDMKPASELPPGPPPGKPQAFIFHHTGGGGDVAGVERTLQQRHLGVQYVMDRDGQIFTTTTLPGQQQMQRGSGAGAGLSNQNTVGMEIIAKDDADVTPAQRAAARKFIEDHYHDTPVYGHGEVNPGHKQPTEGMSVVNDIRAARGQQPKSRLGPTGGAAGAPRKPTEAEWLQQPGHKVTRGPGGVRSITEEGPPQHTTEMEEWRREHAGEPIENFETWRAAVAGNIATARSEAAAIIKDRYRLMSTAGRQQLQSLYMLRNAITDMEASLQDPAVLADRGVVEGRIKSSALHYGFSLGEGENAYQMLQREMEIAAAKPFLQGGRGAKYWIDRITALSPKPGDTGEVVKDKLHQLNALTDEMEAGTKKAEQQRVFPGQVPGEGGPEATTPQPPAPQSTAPPASLDDVLRQHGY